MLAGHASLPNGFGLAYTGADGQTVVVGVAPNSLTVVGPGATGSPARPWHKHVPARIEPLAQAVA